MGHRDVFGTVKVVVAILDWHELNGICYGFASPASALNFNGANSTCAGYNAVLLTVSDLEEHTFLTRFMDYDTDYWVDLELNAATGEYLWPDGTSPNSSLWYPNEPNFTGDRVRYTTSTGSATQHTHLLADIYSSRVRSYICQRNAVRIGETGIGKETPHVSASHYVQITNISTKSRLQCAKTCLQTFKCGLIGYLSSSSECLMLQWAANNASLSVDPGFRFHTIERDCSIS
ncbi:C-type lectin domain family 17, member A-like [Argopecten irradians]|uniref:C-type lectin domain family 17, member A-like n=1 Tax=Argopecten irradians TaxID=31199 RepID=UPI003715A901